MTSSACGASPSCSWRTYGRRALRRQLALMPARKSVCEKPWRGAGCLRSPGAALGACENLAGAPSCCCGCAGAAAAPAG
eukprot:11218025-Lingulodinium_polyedra.AAC.1